MKVERYVKGKRVGKEEIAKIRVDVSSVRKG